MKVKKNRCRSLLFFLLSATSAFTVLFAYTPASTASEPIVIGIAGAHSGDLASYGIPTLRAAKLIIDERNAKCGINNRKIILLIEDDVCKPEIAVNTATKLVSEGVHAVIGHICSGATKAAAGIYRDAKIVVVSPSATNPGLTQSRHYPNFFRTITPDDVQARLEVDFAINVLKIKKIAILHDKGDYGKGLAEYARKFIKESKICQVVLYEGVTPGAVDYSAVVQKIKRKKAEAVIFGGYHPEASKIVEQMRKKKMKTIFISDDGVKDTTFIKVAEKSAEGVYATGPKDTSNNSIALKAIADHKRVYGEDPGAFFLNAYSAVLAVLNAMEKSCSTDYNSIKNALQTEFVATPLGILKFDDKGDAIGVGFSMYQVKDGTFVEIKQAL